VVVAGALGGLGGSVAIAAWRLFRGGKAFAVYLAGYLVDLVQWWFMQGSEAYKRSFTPQELVLDYYILGALAVVGALIWFTERRRRPPAAKMAAGHGG
jgi:hypothetical protein